VGDKVDGAVQSLKRGARDAGEAIREQYAKARTSIHNMGVSSRVYGRLHWDKALNTARIDVDVLQDGVATLTGSVADAAARAKAVELTGDTVGVTKVVDRLAIVPSSPVVPPAGAVPARP
jgi:osmotically-inducible protein OsmY